MKEYRDKEMRNLMLILVSLLLLFSSSVFNTIALDSEQNKLTALSTILETAVVSAALSCTTILIDCLLGSKLKDRLVGLLFIPRAGETVFSRVKNNTLRDDRFLLSDAKQHYSEIIKDLPKEKRARHKYENSKWYGIYRTYSTEDAVIQTQHDYLMCRDLFSETLAFFVLYFLSTVCFPTIIFYSREFVIVLFIVLGLLEICAQSKMQRFVNTVIAIDIADKNKKKE